MPELSPFEEQPLYPRKDSLGEVISFANAQLPITDVNQLRSILMTYHNTMLHTQRLELRELTQ